MDDGNVDLTRALDSRARSPPLTGIPAAATAGVMTTRGAASAFFINGTNRAMFRFTMMNHLCNDLPTHHGHDPPAGSHPPGRDAQPGRRQHAVLDQLHRLPQRHGPDGAGLRLLQLLVSGERGRRDRLAHRTDRLHRRADAAQVPHQQHEFPARVQHAGRQLGQPLAHRTRTRSWAGAPRCRAAATARKSLGSGTRRTARRSPAAKSPGCSRPCACARPAAQADVDPGHLDDHLLPANNYSLRQVFAEAAAYCMGN